MMYDDNHRFAYALEYADLPHGRTSKSELCPVCKGGQSGEMSFRIFRTPRGVLVGKCYRASCETFMFLSSEFCRLNEDIAYAKIATNKPSIPEFIPIGNSKNYTDMLYEHTGIDVDTAIREEIGIFTDSGRIAYKARDSDGSLTGIIARSYTGHSKKVLNFLIKDRFGLCFPRTKPIIGVVNNINIYEGKEIYLVEDLPSAIRLGKYKYCAALLGTFLHQQDVVMLAKRGVRDVVIALDKDATMNAYTMARKIEPLFRSVKVLPLDKDIKNCSNVEIEELLNEQTESCTNCVTKKQKGVF